MSYEECKLALMLLGYRPMKHQYHNFLYEPTNNTVSVPLEINEHVGLHLSGVRRMRITDPHAISYQNIVNVMTERLNDS